MKNIVFGNSVVTFSDSLYITLISMSIVFSILVIISITLYFLKFISKTEENKVEKKQSIKKQENIVSEKQEKFNFENLKHKYEDEGIRLAIITACIHASEEFGHQNIKINYVKEIK